MRGTPFTPHKKNPQVDAHEKRLTYYDCCNTHHRD
nr:MAG TPA: hypothetical protein [Caudoviricetes sp.]